MQQLAVEILVLFPRWQPDGAEQPGSMTAEVESEDAAHVDVLMRGRRDAGDQLVRVAIR